MVSYFQICWFNMCVSAASTVFAPFLLRLISTVHCRKSPTVKTVAMVSGCITILLYDKVYSPKLKHAVDILLVAPSVTVIQRLLFLCEQELTWLHVSLNHHHHHHHLFIHKMQHKMTMYNWRTGHARLGMELLKQPLSYTITIVHGIKTVIHKNTHT